MKKDEFDDAKMSERQFLYHRWSYWTNWYKRQPLDHIRLMSVLVKMFMKNLPHPQ